MNKTTSAWTAGKYRNRLLATVSALALTASAADGAKAADRPVVWIEGGWQFEQMSGLGEPFSPSFVPTFLADGLPSPLTPQKKLSDSYGAEGSISFQPEDSDWIFSASVRYGRAHGHQKIQKDFPGPTAKFKYRTRTAFDRYADASASNSETHIIADFQAGKDVGLGVFGNGSASTLGFGVRFAQFHSQRSAHINGRPDPNFVYVNAPQYLKYHIPVSQYHAYVASAQRRNSFTGIGPSISWNASAPLAGNPSDGEIALDWGVNAAALFGRQRTKVHVQYYTMNVYAGPKYTQPNGVVQLFTNIARAHSSANHTRSRNVIVPNLGGFAGLSFRYADAKVSLGYRADFFVGAMDGGLDTRKSTTRGFYGPFASISMGVGD